MYTQYNTCKMIYNLKINCFKLWHTFYAHGSEKEYFKYNIKL